MRILFVCLGNICRSPSAEGVFSQLTRDEGYYVDSAGTGGWHVGNPPYGPMQDAARARGFDLSGLRARQVSPADFSAFDLIIAMDRQNQADLERLRPAGAGTPVDLFLDYAPETGQSAVPDPYYTRDFDAALDLIEMAAKGLKAHLAAQ